MQSYTKRIFAIVVSMVLVCSFFCTNLTAYAEYTEDGEYLYYVYGDDTVSISKYLGDGGDVVIPSTIEGKVVTSIEKFAFEGCCNLTEITIPDSVKSIGYGAFNGCSSLREVVIPDGVTSIENFTFMDCSSLTKVAIPSSVTSLGEREAFSGCSSLQEVIIPKGVDSIAYRTFWECSSLTNVEIPDTVISIGLSAFEGCHSLTKVTIPSSVTSMEAFAFNCCTSLKEVTIPDGVTSIGSCTFQACSLTNIVIPDSVKSIERRAFAGCDNLTEVIIPDSVTSIGAHAFDGCDRLSDVTLSNNVTDIGEYAFFLCYDLKEITIPSSVTSIGDGAFSYCYDLEEMILPDSVTSIGDGVFSHSGLTDIVIPSSVSSVGTFLECGFLRDIYYLGSESQWKASGGAGAEIPEETVVHYNSILPKQITLDVSDVQLYAGDSVNIAASVVPANATAQKIRWISSDDEIVWYGADGDGKGYVTAKAPGTAIITAKTINGLTASCKVTVKPNSCEIRGHQEETAPADAATCTQYGLTEGKYCARCQKVLKEQTILPALGHQEVINPAVDATCTEDGLTEGKRCARCQEVLLEQSVVPALGHDWGEWVTVKSPTKTTDGKKTRTCSVCKEVETEPIDKAEALETVTGVTAVSVDYDSIQITWNLNSSADSYEICRSTSKSSGYKTCAQIPGGTSKYTDTGLTEGKTYYYKVRASKRTDGVTIYSDYSKESGAKPALKAVTNFKTAAVTYDSVKLAWKKNPSATDYEICRSTKKGSDYTKIATISSGSTSSYTDKDKKLTAGTVYYYKIRAFRKKEASNAKIYSDYSGVISAKPDLSAVTGVKAVSTGYNSIKLTWKKNTDASGYKIYRSTQKKSGYRGVAVISSNKKVFYTDTGLTAGTTYYYKIQAFRNRTVGQRKIYSDDSQMVKAKPVPAKTTILSAKRTGSSGVAIRWKKVKGASGYEIYRSTSKNGKYKRVKILSNGNGVGCEDRELAKGKTYYYKIKVYRKVGRKTVYSEFSNIKSCKVKK